ncbi:MAG: class II fructose-bisphosphate aldolase [Lentisphaerae bacterium]|nr:class II fructose-bisphosphate aldolase [Lentisphaerota bacterium]
MKITEIVDRACRNQTVVPAFNAAYLPMIKPIIDALKKTGTFALVEAARPDVEKFGARSFREVAEEFRKHANPKYTALHLDHVPVIDEDGRTVDWEKLIRDGISFGYDSVMIDGSRLPFEENVRITREVADIAHGKGVAVEAELGAVLGHEQGPLPDYEELFASGKGFTDAAQAAEFARRTGVDWLSVAIGNVHGALAEGAKDRKKPAARLDIEHLKKLRTAAGIPLVLHGGSGIQQAYVLEAIKNGIAKINVGTEIRQVYESAMKERPGDIVHAQAQVEKSVTGLVCDYYRCGGSAL